ncbi:MAG: branched-chain-amino-acid transaminase [Bacillota bacterium]
MSDFVYLNGDLVPAEMARISVFDHGFLYGDGLFETMRSYKGKVFKLGEHLDRLEKSARLLELNLPWEREELNSAIYAVLAENRLDNAYIRLTVTRGEGPVGIDPTLCARPNLVIMAREMPPYNEQVYTKGVKIIIVSTRRNLPEACPPEIKSLNFLNNIFAKMELNKAGITEGIMLNYRGEVTEGTVSNVFIYKAGRLLTPARECGILPGITRDTVLDIASDTGISAAEAVLAAEDLLDAEEVFLTNSGSEITPVVQIGDTVIRNGRPGPVTRLVLNRYRKLAWEKN